MADRCDALERLTGGGAQLRLFAALGVDAPAARTSAGIANAIAAGGVDVRVNAAPELHVTLAFLGNVAEEHVPIIVDAMWDAAAAIPGPTSCQLRGIDRFGQGRVLGVDVDVDLHAMLDAARDAFIDAVTPYAPQVEHRPWRPHMSLLRIGARGRLPEVDEDARLALAQVGWVAHELVLFASEPGPTAASYRVLHTADLGTARSASTPTS